VTFVRHASGVRQRLRLSQAFLQLDMNAFRGLPWRFLASACLEQSSDLAVRGAWAASAVFEAFSATTGLVATGLVATGLVATGLVTADLVADAVGAAAGAWAIAALDANTVATSNMVKLRIMRVL
jgi:hypothetical protein